MTDPTGLRPDAPEPLSLPEQAMPIARAIAGQATPRPDVPDELIVRAAKASSVHFENCDDGETWQDCPDCRRAYDRAHYAVAAVAPEIARQARERAADELFQRFQRMREDGEHDMRTALHHVRDVLRGES